MACESCKAGLTDEDGTGCSCPVYGCRTLEEDAPDLVREYFRDLGMPHDPIVDACDFLSWLPGPVTDAQAADMDEHVRLFLRAANRDECDGCDGHGREDEDGLPCRDCGGRGLVLRRGPKLICSDGSCVCVACGGLVDERDDVCSCGLDFIEDASSLEEKLRASLLAKHEADNDDRPRRLTGTTS